MKDTFINAKTIAIRSMLKKGLKYPVKYMEPTGFSKWLGLATQVPTNKKVKFRSDDALWK